MASVGHLSSLIGELNFEFDSTVRIGLVGEELKSFKFSEVLSGAVQEEIPTLKDFILPAGTVDVLTTGVERKFSEHLEAIRTACLDMKIVMPSYVLPKRAFEDYKEDNTSQVGIAVRKLHVGFLNIFKNYLESLPQKERTIFEQDLCKKLQIKSIDHMIASSDDREQMLDLVFREPLFGHFEDHWNEQVREIFTEGHGCPGKRVKECFNANYGTLKSVYDVQTVERELLRQGINFERTGRMNVVQCYKSVTGKLLPEQGIIVEAEGAPLRFASVTRAHIDDAMLKGRIFDFDHFNLIDYPGVKEGTTLFDLKQGDPRHPYFAERHAPTICTLAFMASMGVPAARGQRDRALLGTVNPVGAHKPKKALPFAAIVTGAPSAKEISSAVSLPPKMRLSAERGAFTNLSDLQRKMHAGQAFVVNDVNDLDRMPVPTNGSAVKDIKGNVVDEKNVRLLRNMEMLLATSIAVTLSTMSGSPNHFGRGHMIEKSFYREFIRWHGDLGNLGFLADTEDEAYSLFESKDELVGSLMEFDAHNYQHHVKNPSKSDFVDAKWVRENIFKAFDQNLDRHRAAITTYGSANSYVDRAFQDAFSVKYESAKFAGLTLDGMGLGGMMLAMLKGQLAAIEDGYNSQYLGVRSMLDVSPLEGDILKWLKKNSHEYELGVDDRHIRFKDGQMNILNLDTLIPRQDIIARMSDIAYLLPGGKGTIVEAMIKIVHNLRVDILGKGILGHNRKVPLIIVDHKFSYPEIGQRGVFDVFNECALENDMIASRAAVFRVWRPEEAIDLGKQILTGKIEFPRHAALGKQKFNFDVSENKLKGYVFGANMQQITAPEIVVPV